jgi:hypothetical protein
MESKQQHDVLVAAAAGKHYTGSGKNFRSLIEAGSWTISGFHYGNSRCACCGRPILHVLHMRNESHRADSPFPEGIEVGIVCGPKVFMESCIGFYEDPEREWDRQHRAWKDFIDYVVTCVKHEKLWLTVPLPLRQGVDDFLKQGYESQDHTGGWWMVKDAKKGFFRCQKRVGEMPNPRVLWAASRSLQFAARRQGIIEQSVELLCDRSNGEFSLGRAASYDAQPIDF